MTYIRLLHSILPVFLFIAHTDIITAIINKQAIQILLPSIEFAGSFICKHALRPGGTPAARHAALLNRLTGLEQQWSISPHSTKPDLYTCLKREHTIQEVQLRRIMGSLWASKSERNNRMPSYTSPISTIALWLHKSQTIDKLLTKPYPINKIIASGHTPLVQRLFEHGMKPTSNQLLLAARFHAIETVQLYIDKGADIHAPMQHWQSLLDYAAFQGNKELVNFLVENGALAHANTQFLQHIVDTAYNGKQQVERLAYIDGDKEELLARYPKIDHDAVIALLHTYEKRNY